MTDAGAATGAAPRRRPRRRIVLMVLGVLALVIAVWAVVAGLVAAHKLRAVREDIGHLTRTTGSDRETIAAGLREDLDEVQSVQSMLDQPGPRVFGWVPLLGRNVDAERVVTDASEAAISAGLTVIESTEDLDDGHGGADVTRMREASTALSKAAQALASPLRRLADQQTDWALPQVGDGVRQARDQLLGLDSALRRGATGLEALTAVFGSSTPQTVAVGLMNNAELRGAGGLLASYATGRIRDGRISLKPFRDVNEVSQSRDKAVRVPAPADFHAEYGRYLADTTLWKNATMSPQGDDSAAVLAALTERSLGVQPDVVVLADVPAAADIVSATGPVTIEGEQVDGEELVNSLLVDAYGEGQLSEADQQRRRRALNSAATQAFDRLQQGASTTPDVLRAVLDAVAGRHLLLWSADPQVQQQLVDARAAGAVDANGRDIVMPITNNFGDSPGYGNKLDYYVDRNVDVSVELSRDKAAVIQSITLHNNAPDDLGPYVEGVAHPGRITELLSLDVAADAELQSFTQDGEDAEVDLSEADGARRLSTVVRLDRGMSTTIEVTYTQSIDDSTYELLLVPQALAKPATLRLEIKPTSGSRLGVVSEADQATAGAIHIDGPWTTTRSLTVPIVDLGGLHGLLDRISNFWTKKIEV
jgi:hypothetical protein